MSIYSSVRRKQIRKEANYEKVKDYIRAAMLDGADKNMMNCAYHDLKKEFKKEASSSAAEVAFAAAYVATVSSSRAKKAIVRHSLLWYDAPVWTPHKKWTKSTIAHLAWSRGDSD